MKDELITTESGLIAEIEILKSQIVRERKEHMEYFDQIISERRNAEAARDEARRELARIEVGMKTYQERCVHINNQAIFQAERAKRLAAALQWIVDNAAQDGNSWDVDDYAEECTQRAKDALATDPAPAPAAQKGRYLTIWRDGSYKVWRQGDAYYAQGDPDWFAEFNLDTLANESETK